MAPVICLLWNDPPDPTTGVCPVIGVTRYQVYVQVKHRLPSGRPVVDANVVALWAELFVQNKFGPVKQLKQFGTFIWRKLKE